MRASRPSQSGAQRPSRLSVLEALVAAELATFDDVELARIEAALKKRRDKATALVEAIISPNPGRPQFTLEGDGIGGVLSQEAASARLDELTVDDESIDWARSELCGIGEVAERLSVAGSTLDNWRRAHRALAFPKGVRNYVFPMAQFAGARPIEGLAAVRPHFDSDEATWEWLVTRDPMTAPGTPLDRLRAGAVAEVVALAQGVLDYA